MQSNLEAGVADDEKVILANLMAVQQASLSTLSAIAAQLTYLLSREWSANPTDPWASVAREAADRARAAVSANDALLSALTAATGEFYPPHTN